MTYLVLSGTLNLNSINQSINQSVVSFKIISSADKQIMYLQYGNIQTQES